LNPGFSVPDYDWKEAIGSVNGWLISTCHSAEEAAVERESELIATRFSCLAHFENPWASLFYHQSGTICCDVFRKNAYISIYKRN